MIIPFKFSLTLFCWDIHQFVFLTWIHVHSLSFSASACFNYGLHDYFQLFYKKWKFHLGLFKSWWNFSSVYREETFSYNRNSIFTLLPLNMRDEISSRFNELIFQPGLNFSTIQSSPKMELFEKIINHFRKRLHLRCLTEFWMCLCCVSDNYLAVNFPTQPYLLLSCLLWVKALSFSIFPIFHETHALALQLATKSCWKNWWHLPICFYITEGGFSWDNMK